MDQNLEYPCILHPVNRAFLKPRLLIPRLARTQEGAESVGAACTGIAAGHKTSNGSRVVQPRQSDQLFTLVRHQRGRSSPPPFCERAPSSLVPALPFKTAGSAVHAHAHTWNRSLFLCTTLNTLPLDPIQSDLLPLSPTSCAALFRALPGPVTPTSFHTAPSTSDHHCRTQRDHASSPIIYNLPAHTRPWSHIASPDPQRTPHTAHQRHREAFNLAGNKRRSFSSNGGLLNRMFGTSPGKDDEVAINDSPAVNDPRGPAPAAPMSNAAPSGNGLDRKASDASSPNVEKKRRSSGVSRARDMFSSAKQSLHLSSNPNAAPPPGAAPEKAETPIQKLGKSDAALSVPQGALNNSAGESAPGPRSTFRVGVTEDKNKKCRRTMEDTHAYLYNFLSTPAPSFGGEKRVSTSDAGSALSETTSQQVAETDNGYFAIFDGHAGTFAADWCGKKLHLILEETIKKNPNTPIPELLDQTFTMVDNQLEKLPLKNSGCTAVTAVLRWEDRVPNAQSSTGSVLFAPAAVSAVKNEGGDTNQAEPAEAHAVADRLQHEASRQRVLYTANVGDARIVLCRNGRALRLSYDHKGSDENEGRRVASAGGLILNNRVNGVLAVTRALGDAYMKDLVTGHPYTTETVIQADQDEFLILACDGLWDVCSDQEAVDLIRQIQDPQEASKKLVDYALARFSTDNLSCMVVRFDNKAVRQRKNEGAMGVEGDALTAKGNITEAEAIVAQARRSIGEPQQSVESATAEIIQEEEEKEPGPELNLAAAQAAQKNPA